MEYECKCLTIRKHFVRLIFEYSVTIDINTRGQGGCVLSAGFFILYYSDMCASQDSCSILKYADDIMTVRLLDYDPLI